MEKRSLPERIEGSRVVLRRHELELAELMFRAVDQDRKRLRRFLPWVDQTLEVIDELAYIQLARDRWDEQTLFDYGLFRRDDGAYLGNVGVFALQWRDDVCELGYWICEASEGQGYVSEAVRTLEATLFQVGFHRIEIRCSSLNLRSSRIPERNGYRLEGTLRESAIEHGQYRSTLVYGKLSTD